jgi:MFS family permease
LDTLVDAGCDVSGTKGLYADKVCTNRFLEVLMMKKHPLFFLFYMNLVVLAVGNGLFPLLPIYAVRFGATPRLIGLYLALVSASITAGALLPGWLPATSSRKRLLLGGGAAGIPALICLSQATALWQLIFFTSVLWFCGGICLALVSVYTSLLSNAAHRGRSFSLLALSGPFGLLFGGLLVGWLLDWQDYPLMFVTLAAWWATLPLVAYRALTDETAVLPTIAKPGNSLEPVSQRRFLPLLGGAMLFAAALNVAQMGFPLSMQSLAFSPAAVSSTSTVAGLVTIPIVLLLGLFADRLNRRSVLFLGYLMTASGALSLAAAISLWHFWLAIVLLRAGQVVNDALAPAVATDLLPPAALPRWLPRLKATNWLAGTLSYLGTGLVISVIGAGPVFVVGSVIAVIAAGLLLLLPLRHQKSVVPIVRRMDGRSA